MKKWEKTEAIRKILRKKEFDPNKAEEAQMQKIYGYLGRKGFRYDDSPSSDTKL